MEKEIDSIVGALKFILNMVSMVSTKALMQNVFVMFVFS